MPGEVLAPLAGEHLPGMLAVWAAQRARLPRDGRWSRALDERLPLVETRWREGLSEKSPRTRALVALRDGEVAAYLIGHDVRLPPGSPYLSYVPRHFLNVAADDWGAATLTDLPALADLYARVGGWAVTRGVAAHLVAIEPGGDSGELWADLGFARHDVYVYLPLGAARAGEGAVSVRRATAADLELATELVASETRHHHDAPVFAYSPPGLVTARRRDLAESLGDAGAFLLFASIGDAIGGVISAYHLATQPSWATTALPTPCLYVESAFVRPEARGRGVLRSLVARLARTAPDGTKGIFVTYLPANLGAARAWAGLGFRPFATIHQRRLDPRAVRQRHDRTLSAEGRD